MTNKIGIIFFVLIFFLSSNYVFATVLNTGIVATTNSGSLAHQTANDINNGSSGVSVPSGYTAVVVSGSMPGSSDTYGVSVVPITSGGHSNPPSLSVSSDKTTYFIGEWMKLTWVTKNIATCTASGSWLGAKASGTHTQSINLTQLGTYNYSLKCIGSDTGGSITRSVTVTVTLWPATGYFDGVDPNQCRVWGWAYDPDNSATSISVHVYKDAAAGQPGAVAIISCPTNVLRTDVNSAKNISGNHGFNCTLPQSYIGTGNHTLYIHAIDITSRPNNLLLTNGKTLNCPGVAPDLTAGLTTPTTATVGVSRIFSATITNIGTGSTVTSFSNFLQIATATNGGGTVSNLTATTMATLASGASNTTSVSHIFPSAGTYSIRACADKTSSAGGGVIIESNEGNNCGGWRDVTVTATATIVNGSCSAPQTHYTCNVGTSVNNVSGSTSWTWKCNGYNGGTNASCIEVKPINGACGTANGTIVATAPTTNLCSSGSATSVTGTGPWNWQCIGTGLTSIDASCSASKAVSVCGDGICTLPETLLTCPQDCKGTIRQF